MKSEGQKKPRTIWLLIFALSALQPIIHVFILYGAPEGTTPTGLHIPDSALFIESMDMFPSGFASPYATCQAEGGAQSITYYSVPHLWLYGILGLIHRLIPTNSFLFYGLANGLGAFFYLWVVYGLLRTVTPRRANLAFLLFGFGGGPGGLLFLLAAVMGLQGHPAFETYFFRFAVYDLMEGPHFNPSLYFARLYYTLSLGCCLGGLSAAIRMSRANDATISWRWGVAIMVGTFLDARYGVFVGGLLVIYLLLGDRADRSRRNRVLAFFALPCGIGFLAAWLLLRTNPAVVENHLTVGSMAVWFSPLAIVMALPLLAGMGCIGRVARCSEERWVRILFCSAIGYLVAYGAGYLVYQAYYGNLLTGRDGSVAAAVSDLALFGAVAGGLVGFLLPAKEQDKGAVEFHAKWVVFWLLAYTALSISGFGQGWFLRFGPQRLQILLWLPLCIVAAEGMTVMKPAARQSYLTTILIFGISSVVVANFCFQAPLGRSHGAGPWSEMHAEIMSDIDARLLRSLGEGNVLAPAPVSDVVVRQRRNPVVFGVGTFNLTDQPFQRAQEAAAQFFSPASDDALRQEIVSTWCVEWVYVPHTWPVSPQTRLELAEVPWAELVASEGDGAVYRVHTGAEVTGSQ